MSNPWVWDSDRNGKEIESRMGIVNNMSENANDRDSHAWESIPKVAHRQSIVV